MLPLLLLLMTLSYRYVTRHCHARRIRRARVIVIMALLHIAALRYAYKLCRRFAASHFLIVCASRQQSARRDIRRRYAADERHDAADAMLLLLEMLMLMPRWLDRPH